MKHKFFTELSRRLAERGIESVSKEGAQLEIILHAQPVLYASPGNALFLLPAGSNNEEAYELYHQVAEVADKVYEYVDAVQSAPILYTSGLDDKFHLLADFGGAVLAGRERENGRGYHFVTWIWDYGRRGVSHGHYYEGDLKCQAGLCCPLRFDLQGPAFLLGAADRAVPGHRLAAGGRA